MIRICLILVLFLWPLLAQAACVEPFPNRNQIPTASIFLELTGLSPCVLPVGKVQMLVSGQVSNTSLIRDESNAHLLIDLERTETRLVLRRGLPGKNDLSLEIGYVWFSGGRMDNFIDGYHEIIGRDPGDRERRPRDQFEYSLSQESGGQSLRITDPPSGATEPVLTFRHQASSFGLGFGLKVRWGWRVAFKLPIGDPSPVISSRKPDVGGGLMFDTTLDTLLGPFGMFGNLGAAYFSETDAAIFPIRRLVPMGTAGISKAVAEGVTLLLQSQLSGSRHKHPILDRPQNILIFGAQIHLGGHLISVAFSEDANTASEDVGLLIAYTSKPF